MSGPGTELERWLGSASVLVRRRGLSRAPLVGLRCTLGDDSDELLALLDTGAEWSVVAPHTARAGGAVPVGERFRLSTRHGAISGDLSVLDVHLLAEAGANLTVAAQVFVPDRWPADAPQLVLGFRGLLENIRFALAPRAGGHAIWFGA